MSIGRTLSPPPQLLNYYGGAAPVWACACPRSGLVAQNTGSERVGLTIGRLWVGSPLTQCVSQLAGNREGQTVRWGRPPLLPSCKKLEFKTVSVDGLGSGMGKW